MSGIAASARAVETREPSLVDLEAAGCDHLQRRYGSAEVDPMAPANDVIALILRHRSVRKFLPDPIPDEQIRLIVAAAQSAPTGLNFQNWSVVLVRDKERKARIAKLAADQQFIRDAPVLLIWVADWARAGDRGLERCARRRSQLL